MREGVKRIGIFVYYDSEGIVDDYVVYYLQNIVSVLEKLVIVVNGEISEGGKRKLERISSSIFFRENNGLDAAAWKLALTEYIGWDEISTFDEIVLFNGTVFGPFIPFKDIFDKAMSQQTVDK